MNKAKIMTRQKCGQGRILRFLKHIPTIGHWQNVSDHMHMCLVAEERWVRYLSNDILHIYRRDFVGFEICNIKH